MILRRIIVIICALYPTLSFSQWDVKKAMESGMSAMDNHDYMTSIAFFTRVINARPNNHKAFYFRGKAKYQLGDYAGCEADETEAISLNPYYYDAYELRAFSREEIGKYILASEDFSIAVANSYNRFDLAEHQALCNLKGGNYQAADSLAEKLLKWKSSNANLYIVRAKAQYGLADYLASESYIDQALSLEPYLHEALTIKALYLMKAHDWKKAAAYYSKALYVNPKNSSNIANRGLCMAMSGDKDSAISDFNLLMDVSPDNWIANKALRCDSHKDWENLTDSVLRKNELNIIHRDDSQPHKEKACEIAKDYEFTSPQYISDYQNDAYKSDTQFKSSYQLLLNRKYNDAIEGFSQIIQTNNLIPEAYFNRAYAYIRAQQYQKACEDLTKATDLRENYAEAYYNRGLVKLFMNDPYGANMDFSLAGQYGISYAYKLIARIKNTYF